MPSTNPPTAVVPAAGPAQQESLFELLAERAQAVSSRHLALSLGAGFVAMLGAVLDLSTLSATLAALGGCQAAFGVWGLAERRLQLDAHRTDAAVNERAWRWARNVALSLGVASGVLLANLLAFGFVGRWIS